MNASSFRNTRTVQSLCALGPVVADEQANAVLDLEAGEDNIEGERKQRVRGANLGLQSETTTKIQDIGQSESGQSNMGRAAA
jgi:hypothetical protein